MKIDNRMSAGLGGGGGGRERGGGEEEEEEEEAPQNDGTGMDRTTGGAGGTAFGGSQPS